MPARGQQEPQLGQAPGETASQRRRQIRQVRPGYARAAGTGENAALSAVPEGREMNEPYVPLQGDTRRHLCATENYT